MERALSGLGDGTMARYKLVVAEHKPFKSDAHSVATEQEIERDLQSALAALEIEAGCLTDEPRNTVMWQMVSKAVEGPRWQGTLEESDEVPETVRHTRQHEAALESFSSALSQRVRNVSELRTHTRLSPLRSEYPSIPDVLRRCCSESTGGQTGGARTA